MAIGLELASCSFCGKGATPHPPVLVLAIEWSSENWTAADIVIPDCFACHDCITAMRKSLDSALVVDSEGIWFKAGGKSL